MEVDLVELKNPVALQRDTKAQKLYSVIVERVQKKQASYIIMGVRCGLKLVKL
jgi:hypothetical protein